MAYIYDPSQQISQSLGKTAAGIGDIFTQVIAGKQQDFTLAQEAEANIQALKKNLNQFSQDNITGKSNALLEETRSSIFKNGKLDYSKLREIRNKITDIADLKQGYEVANQEFERRLQLGIANKDEMLSFTNFYSDLSNVMSNEDLIKRPQDLSNAMNTAYYKNLDANKVSRKILGSQLGGVQKMGGTVMTKDKNGKDVEVKYAAESYAKFKYNPTTNQMEADPSVNWDEVAANIESQNPEYMKMLEVQFGAGTSFMSKGELVKRMALQSAGTPVYDVTKSAEELQMQKNQLTIQSKTIEKLNLEMNALRNADEFKEASNNVYNINLKGEQTKKKTTASAVDFGKSVKMYQYNNEFNVIGFAKTKEGIYYAKVTKDKEGGQYITSMSGKTGGIPEGKNYTWLKIENPDKFINSIDSQLQASASKSAKANIYGGINAVENFQSTPTLQSNQVSSPASTSKGKISAEDFLNQ